MPTPLQTSEEVIKGRALIEKACPYIYILTKLVKPGTLLPSWHISNPNEWTNSLGSFDMQQYLHDYLNQYGLDWTINGNDQIQVISFP